MYFLIQRFILRKWPADVHSTYAVDDALSAAIVNNERRVVSRHKYWPPLLPSRQPSLFVPHSLLYSGARYVGNQKHKGNSSDVEVFIHSVDEAAHTLCGYLVIRGLNDQNPVLETFFTGEIISDRHPFLTRKWEADQDVDKKHWGKFGAFAHVRDVQKAYQDKKRTYAVRPRF